MNDKQLGDRIRIAREKSGTSQEELATFLGLGQATISQLEKGKRKVTVTELLEIAYKLGVSYQSLLSDETKSDELDLVLIELFHRLPKEHRETVVEIVRLLITTLR